MSEIKRLNSSINEDKKRKRLSYEAKLKIIAQLDAGISVTQLAADYNCGERTIYRIKEAKNELQNILSSHHKSFLQKKKFADGKFPELESALFQWFVQKRRDNVPLSDVILQHKAQELFKTVYPSSDVEFLSSRGFVRRFRIRHGIRILKITGEKVLSDYQAIEPFIKKLSSVISEMGITPDQIYNADESGLYYKLLPTRTLVTEQEKVAPGRKVEKKRLTFMPCCNMTGTHKLPLHVIGTAKRPRCFTSAEMTNLPVDYENSHKGWATKATFERWFQNTFIPEVRRFCIEKNLRPSALLVLDNAPSHFEGDVLQSDDGLIRVIYLPPNCTAVIQPMDQHVIYNIKRKYLSKFLAEILKDDESVFDLDKRLKNITIKDAVYWLASSWDDITHTLIKGSWKKLIMSDTFDNTVTNISPIISNLLESEEINSDNQIAENEMQILKTMSIRLGQQAQNLQVEALDFEKFFTNVPQIYALENNLVQTLDESDEESPVENCFEQGEIIPEEALKSIENVKQFFENNNFPLQNQLAAHKLNENILMYKFNNNFQ